MIHIETRKLLDATKRAASVTAANVIPILSHVRMETREGGLILTGTDLDRTITCRVDGRIELGIGACVPAAPLVKTLAQLPPEGETSIWQTGTQIFLKNGRSKVKFDLLQAKDFPVDVEPAEAWLPIDPAIIGMINRVKHAMAASANDIRFYLCGVHVMGDGKRLTVEAANGHVAARCSVESTDKANIIIPSGSVPIIAWLPDISAVYVSLENRKVSFQAGDTTLTTKTVDGVFPDLEMVIPPQVDKKITIKPSEMAQAVKLVTASGNKDDMVILGLVGDYVEVSTAAANTVVQDHGKAGSMEKVTLNALYLLNALGQFKGADLVNIYIKGATMPVRIDSGDDDSVAVIMPCRK